jgi:uncharacterized protein with FMN-binding domain
MAKRMPRRLVALSASAVASIYAAGLLSTQSAADVASAAPITPTMSSTGVAASSAATTLPVVGATARAGTASTTTYADGTYSGTGTSRFGNVSVSVTVAGGAMSNVQITRVTTSYPVSRIASLPAQVVQKQTANVNIVTGATYSSQAFEQAVQQALTQALAS